MTTTVARRRERRDFFCDDCRMDTLSVGEYYMVKKHVWHEATGQSWEGILCIGCLEARLRRVLTAADFNQDVLLNYMPNQSERLRARKSK